MVVQRTHTIVMILAIAGVLMLGFTLTAHAADADEGKKLYGQFCVSCHGESGKGEGPAAAALNPKPRDHTDKAYMSTLSDEHLFNVIKNGGASVGKSPLMPPWGASIKDEQIKDVVAYLHKLCQCP